MPGIEDVPLPANVDDWVMVELRTRGITFKELASEALSAHPEAFGEGAADQLSVALMLLFCDRTGDEPDVMGEWRRAQESRLDPAVQERRMANWAKHDEIVSQMKARSGPYYERSVTLSAVLGEAWRRAGRPRHVYKTWSTPSRYWVKSTGREVEVGEAEWAAWAAWEHEREKIRERLGVSRQWNSKVPRGRTDKAR